MNHDFLLLDRETDGEWELLRFIHDPRALYLHDDLVWYMGDTLNWIPTVNPAGRMPHRGLCMWGPTLIEAEGAGIAERVFRAWEDLFAIGPSVISLLGSYSWIQPEEESPAAERAAQLEGRYERLEFYRDEIVSVLHQIAEYSRQVHTSGGRLYLYHGGI